MLMPVLSFSDAAAVTPQPDIIPGMFTGIVQTLGRVERYRDGKLRLKAKLQRPRLGASVAVNGVCLTVVASRGGALDFDVSPETLRLTNLGRLAPGAPVNLETSLKLGDGLDGHLVSGHVDAVAKVLQLESLKDGSRRFRVELPAKLRPLVAYKGSIAVDGTSLTVTGVSKTWFETVLIPHTLKATNLGARKRGELVNLEADMLARYVQVSLQARRKG